MSTREIFVDKARPRERAVWAFPVAIVMVVACLWPLSWHPRNDDDFPLSNYPMFSGRASAEVSIPHVIALDPEGNRTVVADSLLSGGEVMQAFESLRIIVAAGGQTTQDFCERVAEQLENPAASGDANYIEVQVVTDTFNAVEYFENGRQPAETVVHAACTPGGDDGS